ncbi:uncharacterized protein LOC118422990 [Branchiostoma floridae]|uniref:Uncharacterized protein LOC118422990 n=1 Tax=Branchiostoma floridae TaxID=7739 RepID=A0A9J7LQH9_BRAFL|nr:uncharacterized protein LOC118422990 [Branchiostoma floridae]
MSEELQTITMQRNVPTTQAALGVVASGLTVEPRSIPTLSCDVTVDDTQETDTAVSEDVYKSDDGDDDLDLNEPSESTNHPSDATPMQQQQTDWRSIADAAANVPNPMYAQRADGEPAPRVLLCSSRTCAQLVCAFITASVGVAMILTGVFIAGPLKSPPPNPLYPTTQIRTVEVFTSTAYTNTAMTTFDYITTRKNLHTSISQYGKGTMEDDGKRDVITFGGRGSMLGKFTCLAGVAVSSRNEIFVADHDDRRVQVFNMDGVYIRHFLTTVPEKPGSIMTPQDISIDDDDNLWVVGKLEIVGSYAVQYDRDGRALAKFGVPNSISIHGIAVDLKSDNIVITKYDIGGCKMFIYHSNGTFVRKLQISCSSSIAVNRDGDICTLDYNIVHVFNQTGHLLFNFGGDGRDNGGRTYPRDICTDMSGHILVANQGQWHEKSWVSIFSGQGKFVRKVATELRRIYRIAVGPEGRLLVTARTKSILTENFALQDVKEGIV